MMTIKRALIGGVASIGILAASVVPSLAHHSFAMFDGSQIKVFTGVVTRINPDANHLQIFFAPLDDERRAVIRNDDGEPQIWAVEMNGAAQAAQDGISVNGFAPGTIFSIGLHPLRNGQPGGDRGESALYKCPANTPPAAGDHCWSLAEATAHGDGEIPHEGELEEEYVPE
ncbi:DUF6152 family protein [Pelagibacterium nitratireducens]|uniref:DUF6152 family protein n=1 Tax=Pelagibacterium nitratireducens TaxID=1046114 RepID=A0ABZ2HZF0_9HYPH